MVFERAKPQDIGELTELRIKYLLEDHGEIAEDKLKMIAGELPGYFREHLERDLYAFVCRAEDGIAGCCLLYVSEKPPNPTFIKGRTGTVLNVYTRPQYRRKGIAGRLMGMLLRWSEEIDLDYVELKATEDGYRLYLSLGFEEAADKYHNMKYIIDRRNIE